MDPQLQALGLQLADSAVRNTAGTIADRIRTSKAQKRQDETIAELEEIISGLLSDKSELVRIAKAFEDELVAQRIGESDIAYITDHLVPIVQQLAESMGESGTDVAQAEAAIEIMKPLLSVETVTIFQLLGFNFRRAIGEPLTDLVASLISARQAPNTTDRERELGVQREIAYLAVAQDPEAFDRLRTLFGQS